MRILDSQSAAKTYTGIQKFNGNLLENISKRAEKDVNLIKASNNRTIAINNAEEDKRTDEVPRENETAEQPKNAAVPTSGYTAPGQIIDFRA